jgi:choline transport protein
MISTAVINSTLGLLMLIMFCFCLTDLESALGSSTGYPFIYVFYNATQSHAGTILMSMTLIILLACSSTSVLATASRQVFSFARDGGLPFSHVFATVNTKVGHELPLNAVIVSLGITVILALINLGSTAAFNSVVSIQISSLFTSYFISISCILIKRIKGEPLPPSRWSMGRLAIPMNILALMYILFVFVMTLFPTALPVSPVNMNWAILIWGTVVLFAIGSYFVHGHKTYQGPVVMVNKNFDGDFSPIGMPTN